MNLAFTFPEDLYHAVNIMISPPPLAEAPVPPYIVDGMYTCNSLDLSGDLCTIMNNIDEPSGSRFHLCFLKSDKASGQDIIYAPDGRIMLILFVPKAIRDDEYDDIDRITHVYESIQYVCTTMDRITFDDTSLFNTLVKILPSYIVICAMTNLYTGITYNNFIEAFGKSCMQNDHHLIMTEPQYHALMDLEPSNRFDFFEMVRIAKIEE